MFRDVPLKPAAHRLTENGGGALSVRGTCQLRCRHRNKSLILDFYVIDTNAKPVMAMKTCRDLNLVKMGIPVSEEKDAASQSIMNEYADLFQGIEEFPVECTFSVTPDMTPVVCPPHRIPIAQHSKLKDALDSMEKQNIICKVTEPTEWVNALVVVERPKTGKLRICLDPRALNIAITLQSQITHSLHWRMPPQSLQELSTLAC